MTKNKRARYNKLSGMSAFRPLTTAEEAELQGYSEQIARRRAAEMQRYEGLPEPVMSDEGLEIGRKGQRAIESSTSEADRRENIAIEATMDAAEAEWV